MNLVKSPLDEAQQRIGSFVSFEMAGLLLLPAGPVLCLRVKESKIPPVAPSAEPTVHQVCFPGFSQYYFLSLKGLRKTLPALLILQPNASASWSPFWTSLYNFFTANLHNQQQRRVIGPHHTKEFLGNVSNLGPRDTANVHVGWVWLANWALPWDGYHVWQFPFFFFLDRGSHNVWSWLTLGNPWMDDCTMPRRAPHPGHAAWRDALVWEATVTLVCIHDESELPLLWSSPSCSWADLGCLLCHCAFSLLPWYFHFRKVPFLRFFTLEPFPLKIS